MRVTSPSEEHRRGDLLSKVSQVTLMFWVIKICATTVGETGGEALSMTEQVGYAVSSLIFLGFFCIALAAQVAPKRYHPFVYWVVAVATTTVGTTMSDYLDRTLGLGYVKIVDHAVLWRHGHPPRMAPRHGSHRVREHHHEIERGLLLGDDSSVKHARHGAG